MQDPVDGLRAQLEQLRLNLDELSRELAEARVERIRQTLIDVLASSPSPLTVKRTNSFADLSVLDWTGDFSEVPEKWPEIATTT